MLPRGKNDTLFGKAVLAAQGHGAKTWVSLGKEESILLAFRKDVLVMHHRLGCGLWLVLATVPLGSCKPRSLQTGQVDQTRAPDVVPGSGVELEVRADAAAWQVIRSQGDRAGDLLEALPRDVQGTAASILWEAGVKAIDVLSKLPPERKNHLIQKLSGLRTTRFFQLPGGRTIPGLELARRLERPPSVQPWTFGGLELVSNDTVFLDELFEPEIEYGLDPLEHKEFSLFEWHTRCDALPKAGDCYMASHWLAQSLQVDIRSVHVHALGHVQTKGGKTPTWFSGLTKFFLPQKETLDALLLAEYVRRLNLWMDMHSFVESEISIARRPGHYELLHPSAYANLLSGLLGGSLEPGAKRPYQRIFASVAFQFPGKYGDDRAAGLEVRGFWSRADLPLMARRQRLLNSIHASFAAGKLPVDRQALGRWLSRQNFSLDKLSAEDITRLSWLAHGGSLGELLSRLDTLFPAPSDLEPIRAWLQTMNETQFDAKVGVTLVLHNWESDPWFAGQGTLQAKLKSARQRAALELTRLPRHYETVRGFLVESGLYDAALESLNLPALR